MKRSKNRSKTKSKSKSRSGNRKIKYFDILWIGYHIKVNASVGKDFDIPEKIWGLFGYIINKKAAKKMVELYPITNQVDSEIPKVFPELVVLAVKEDDRLILSPTSEESTQFGSDIQFNREGFINATAVNNFMDDPVGSLKFMAITITIALICMFLFWLYQEKIAKK